MAPDTALLREPNIEENGHYLKLMELLDPADRESFSPEQRAALADATSRYRWDRHPTDLRLSIPWFRRRFYFVFLAGEERRDRSRRQAERRYFPIATWGNVLVISGLAAFATLVGCFVWTLLFAWYLSA